MYMHYFFAQSRVIIVKPVLRIRVWILSDSWHLPGLDSLPELGNPNLYRYLTPNMTCFGF
jgi:hypothetical protein